MTNCFMLTHLTIELLENLSPGIFARGETVDGPDGANVAGTGKIMRWVAVRGDVADWAIYVQNPHYINSTEPDVLAVGYGGVWDWEKIRREGDQIHFEKNIRQLVPCDDAAFKRYRL